MTTSAAWLASELHARLRAPRPRLVGDRGEGVVSAAIAVLIMAFLGALMWVAFNTMWNNTQTRVCREVGEIGGDNQPVC
jgi:hypothetical protein